MNRTPKENHVTTPRPALLPRKYATGDNKRGIKVAVKRKYDSANPFDSYPFILLNSSTSISLYNLYAMIMMPSPTATSAAATAIEKSANI